MKHILIILLALVPLTGCSQNTKSNNGLVKGTESNDSQLKYQLYNVKEFKKFYIVNRGSGNSAITYSIVDRDSSPDNYYYTQTNIAVHSIFNLYVYETFFSVEEKYSQYAANQAAPIEYETTTIYDRNGYSFRLVK